MAQQLYRERTGATGIQMPGQVSVPVMPADTRGAALLGAVADAGEKIGGILARDYARDQMTRIQESLLAARKEFSAWQAQYIQTRQGSNALTAEEDFSAKMREIADRQLSAFGGRSNEIFQRELGGQMAALTLRAQEQGAVYASGQRDRWETSVLEGQRAQLLADAERDPGNGQWLDFQLMEYGRSLASRGLDATAPMLELGSAVQLRRGLAYVQRGDLESASALLQGWKSGGAHPGDLSARYESGAAGSAAIGYDKKGGTSYGRFQLSSKQGSMDGFLRFLEGKGGEAAAIAARLRAAGPADTGGKSGAMPEAWKREARMPGFADLEREYIQREFYDPAMRSLPSGAAAAVLASPQLQQMVWSTAVQHGAGGAADILRKAWRDGMGNEDFVRAAYAERATRFGGSDPDVRASVQRRLRREADDLLGGLSGAGGVNGMSLAAAAQLEGAISAAEKKQRTDSILFWAQNIVDGVQNMPKEERDAAAFGMLDEINDLEIRRELIGVVNEQLRYLDAREEVATALTVKEMADRIQRDGLDPIAAEKMLEQSGMKEEARAAAMERAFGKITENAANRAALDELRMRIDRKEITDKAAIEVAAMNSRMTNEQIKAAMRYLDEGGKFKNATITIVESTFRKLSGQYKMPEGFYDVVISKLPDGKTPSDKELENIISNLIMSDGGVLFFRETLFEAMQKNRDSKWLPSIDDADRKRISPLVEQEGLAPTDENIRKYKKALLLGNRPSIKKQEAGESSNGHL